MKDDFEMYTVCQDVEESSRSSLIDLVKYEPQVEKPESLSPLRTGQTYDTDG